MCLSTLIRPRIFPLHTQQTVVLGVLSPSLFSVPVSIVLLLVVDSVNTGMLLAYCFADESLVCG